MTMVMAEYWPAWYLLNSRSLTLGLEEVVEENNHLMQVTDKLQSIPEINSTLQLHSDSTVHKCHSQTNTKITQNMPAYTTV